MFINTPVANVIFYTVSVLPPAVLTLRVLTNLSGGGDPASSVPMMSRLIAHWLGLVVVLGTIPLLDFLFATWLPLYNFIKVASCVYFTSPVPRNGCHLIANVILTGLRARTTVLEPAVGPVILPGPGNGPVTLPASLTTPPTSPTTPPPTAQAPAPPVVSPLEMSLPRSRFNSLPPPPPIPFPSPSPAAALAPAYAPAPPPAPAAPVPEPENEELVAVLNATGDFLRRGAIDLTRRTSVVLSGVEAGGPPLPVRPRATSRPASRPASRASSRPGYRR